MKKTVVAIDMGMTWGRGAVAEFDGERIRLKEILRFRNTPVRVKNSLFWDVLRQYKHIKRCIRHAAPYHPQSVSIDSWGNDFVLIDRNGVLLGNPYHFMDERTSGMVEYLDITEMSKKRLYEITGVEILGFNTIFQLEALMLDHDSHVELASEMLFMADYFNYLLCGEDRTDPSLATTSLLVDARTKQWSHEILNAIGLDKPHPAGITPSGTVLGTLLPEITEELETVNEPVEVILGCGHDTQCSIAAVPAEEEQFLYISSGACCMFGTELDEPIINEQTEKYRFSNETGFGGKTTLLKNIVGLWLLHNCRYHWGINGREFDFSEQKDMALAAKPFAAMFDVNADEFFCTYDVPARMRDYFEFTGQDVPDGLGGYIRSIYESLAMKFRVAKEEFEEVTGRSYDRIYLVGAGAGDDLLGQFTANACGCEVVCGPEDSTCLGNAAIQFITKGDIKDLAEARRVIAASIVQKVFKPRDTDEWNAAYERYKEICSNDD